MENKTDRLITILGPTASGKTDLAAHLAAAMNGEIISADSRQVYRGMDIGTGKDLGDYVVDGRNIPYHLIDIADPGTKYNVFEYQRDFLKAYKGIVERGNTPILCGGTGMYIEAILKGYRLFEVPENKELRESLSSRSLEELTALLVALKQENGSTMHNSTDVDTVKRAIRAIEIETYYKNTPVEQKSFPDINSIVFGVSVTREERRQKITSRLRKRLAEGMIDEIKGLIDGGVKPEDLIYYGLEYKFVTQYVIGEITYDEMFSSLEIAIHQFAKRQMTWFRGMERRGIEIHWIDAMLPMDEKIKKITEWL